MSSDIYLLVFLLVLIMTIVLTGFILYNRALKSADWYEEIAYKFQSNDCPHEKIIKVADAGWRINFTLKREKSKRIEVAGFGLRKFKEERRFYCEECGQRRWFHLTNGAELSSTLTKLRLKYLLGTAGSLFLIMDILRRII